MSEPATPNSTTKAPALRRILIDLSIMTVIGVFLGLIGPFGSIEQPLAVRLVSWLTFAYLGYAIYSPMSLVVEWGARALALPRWGLWIAACLIATVPMTIAVWVIGTLPPPIPVPSLEEALISYGYVLVIGGGVTLLFNALGNAGAGAEPEQLPVANSDVELAADPVPDGPRLIERLPPALGSDVIALEMEDHYVRVHTALGSEMVLMRLRDAMAELDGIEGRQVHRSWWVARGAVEDVVRDGRNVRLKLARDIEAPVSRAQVSVLKDAGWI